MPILRRILKYTPVVVLGLLVVAWAVTLIGHFGYSFKYGQHGGLIGFYDRCLRLAGGFSGDMNEGWFWYQWPKPPAGAYKLDHSPHLTFKRDNYYGWELTLPITLLLTGILPLAIGPFLSFRFRIWHYLAYTALVAVELAYYLRWQE
jgi:hypothetical protein